MARRSKVPREITSGMDDAEKAALLQAIQAVNEVEDVVSMEHIDFTCPESSFTQPFPLNIGPGAEQLPLSIENSAEQLLAQSPLDACADGWAQYCLEYWSKVRPVQPLWSFLPEQLSPERHILKPVSPYRKLNKGVYPGNASVLREKNPPAGKIAVYSTMYAMSVAESWPETQKRAAPKKRSSQEFEEGEAAACQRSKQAKKHHGLPKRPWSGRSTRSLRSTSPSADGSWALRKWARECHAFRTAGRMYRFVLNIFRPTVASNNAEPTREATMAEAECTPAERVVHDRRLKTPSECRPSRVGACGLPGLAQSKFASESSHITNLDEPRGPLSDRWSMAPGAVISKIWLQQRRGIHGKGSLVDSQWATEDIKQDVQAFDMACAQAPTLCPDALHFLHLASNAQRSSSWALPAVAATIENKVVMTTAAINTAGLITPPETPRKPSGSFATSPVCMGDIEMSDAAPAVKPIETTAPAAIKATVKEIPNPAPASRAVPRPKGARAPILLSF